MKRELKLAGNEDSGFDSIEDAVEWCKQRKHITYAKIGKAERFHVIVGAFEHWSRYFHWVAVYEVKPHVTLVPDNEQ